MSVRRAGADFLPVLIPDENPTAFPAGDGVARYANNLTNIRDIQRFQDFAFGIIDTIERIILRHKEYIYIRISRMYLLNARRAWH